MTRTFFRQQLADFFFEQKDLSKIWWLWIVVMPLVPLMAYMSLGLIRILPASDVLPRHLYIVVGMTSWLLLADLLIKPHQSIIRQKAGFVRQEISLLEALSAWVPERSVGLLLQLFFMLTMVYLSVGLSALNALYYLAVFALGIPLFFGLGALIGILGLVSPSFFNVVEVTNRFLLFVSAAIFPLPDSDYLEPLKVINPYYVFIDNARNALVGAPLEIEVLASWTGIGLLLLLFLRFRLQPVASDVREFLA